MSLMTEEELFAWKREVESQVRVAAQKNHTYKVKVLVACGTMGLLALVVAAVFVVAHFHPHFQQIAPPVALDKASELDTVEMASATDKSFSASPALFPTEFRANITWGCYDAHGTVFNAWTGQVHYSWPLRSLRTEVQPPSHPEPSKCLIGTGPPIDAAGTFLITRGTHFQLFNTTLPTPTCRVAGSPFGAPRPTWVQDWKGIYAGSEMVNGRKCSRWEVDVARAKGAPKEAWNQGCFQYLVEDSTGRPCRFGGPTCTNGTAPNQYPAGTFIEYVDFQKWTGEQSLFTLPASCPSPSDKANACHGTCSPAEGPTGASAQALPHRLGCPVASSDFASFVTSFVMANDAPGFLRGSSGSAEIQLASDGPVVSTLH